MKTRDNREYLKIERRSPRIAVDLKMIEFMLEFVENELKRSSKAYNYDEIHMLVLWKERMLKAINRG